MLSTKDGSTDMPKVTSKDGTSIDYDSRGQGPAIILVGGATQFRGLDQATPLMADMLADRFTVINYDRRGRGESSDTKPYAVRREIEDIEALIDMAGGIAFVYGMSSGAVLAIEAAAALPDKIAKVVAYEPPVNVEQSGEEAWGYVNRVKAFADRGDGGGAAAEFMSQVGMPAEAIAEMKNSPIWPAFASVGPTIVYDLTTIAEATEHGLPPRWQAAKMPILVVNGGASYDFMGPGADAVAQALPNARRKTLPGQGHDAAPEALAAVLGEFFGG